MHWLDIGRSWLPVAAAFGLAFAWAWHVLQRWVARARLQRRMLRARQAERDAPAWLAKHGYAVLDAQVTAQYELTIDGERIPIAVRADYVVERAGLRYVAEVKSGGDAPRIQTHATRRQLLEYCLAFAADGVLLVDAEAERVHEVRFPSAQRVSPRNPLWPWALGLCVLAVLLLLRAR